MTIPTPRTEEVFKANEGYEIEHAHLAALCMKLEIETIYLEQLVTRALALYSKPKNYETWQEENDIRVALNNILYPKK